VQVRHPESGRGSRDVALYREAVRLIRDSGVDVVLNRAVEGVRRG
jgi:uncharacterized protein (DUF849 family)